MFDLSPDHATLRADARALAADLAPRARELRRHLLDHAEHHPALWEPFAARGWPGLATGGDLLGMAVVLEAFAAHGLVLWMPVLTSAIGHAIAQAGPDAARERWLDPIARGDASLALAATEPECGHNLFRVRTTIRRDGDGYVVDGTKCVTSGVDVAARVLVFGCAPEPRSYTAVLVDPEVPGVTLTELPMRHREGVRQFALELKGVAVGSDAVVGVEGQGLLALWPFTHVERILTAAICVGAAEHAVGAAVARAKERQVFGTRPIGADQAVAHPLADLHARTEATRLLVHRTAARADAGVDGVAVAAEANMAKVLTADLAYDAVDHALQTLGAEAWDERAGWLDAFLDARLARSAPVSQELARDFVAQHVLGLPAHR
jgi:alkylation response protein AidB-like acyl-CoA dehydrogenase